ncbi:PLP-dependent transferase [Microthyrium microscopicum]|uniref:PLP-dependent transferase n=1 Tax=Microthyrium microscopicum TaxID=703497 RepID=A0A6A6U931_9PEZI|nr:PLP-dependent transferase [Microthyrium microscopicum]
MQTQELSSQRYGRKLRSDFLFAKDFTNMNHGSFGTYPLTVRDTFRSFQDQVEARPDPFIFYDYPVLLDEARAEVAKLLNAPVGEVVFVPNATTGINTILRNLVFQPGDVIIYFATTYGACQKSVTYITETTPAEDFKIQYTYPVSDTFLVDSLQDAISEIRNQGKNPRLALFDTVVSMPGVRMPYERFLAVCKREGILSCMDAAHAIGMLKPKDVDMSILQPDFFVSNCHKWLYVPRGCAVLYVPTKHHSMMRSTIPTSHGFIPTPRPGAAAAYNPLPTNNKSPFVVNFEFVGTIDNAPYLCVPRAIQYRKERLGGEEAVADYLWTLARRSGQIVCKILGTEVLENEDNTLQNCAFSNVRLPLDAAAIQSMAETHWMLRTLFYQHNTSMVVLWYAGVFWTRLSAQVYLEEADFERGGHLLLELCGRVTNGDFLPACQVQSKL